VKFDVVAEQPVVDSRGRVTLCDHDEVGEILGCINAKRANQAFTGYTSAEATKKKIMQGAFRDGDQFFRSGDLMRMDSNGFVYFVDRIGDTFRWKGENVSTNEVADALSRCACVEEANVYGVQLPDADGRIGMAAIVFGDAGPNWKQLAEHVKKELPSYAVPYFVRPLCAQEITGTFKHRKVELVRDGWLAGGDDVFFYGKRPPTLSCIDNSAEQITRLPQMLPPATTCPWTQISGAVSSPPSANCRNYCKFETRRCIHSPTIAWPSLPPEADAEARSQRAHIVPVEYGNKQRVAGFENRLQVRGAAKQGECIVIDISDVNLTRGGGEAAGKGVQAVAVAGRVQAHVLVALQRWRVGATTQVEGGDGGWGTPAPAPARCGWDHDEAATQCLRHASGAGCSQGRVQQPNLQDRTTRACARSTRRRRLSRQHVAVSATRIPSALLLRSWCAEAGMWRAEHDGRRHPAHHVAQEAKRRDDGAQRMHCSSGTSDRASLR
jgi:hypothetical protein